MRYLILLFISQFSFKKENNGASENPCSETYAGPSPFSEPETAALRNFLTPIGRQINIYLSFHSYGQYILFPFGHTDEEVTEYHELMVCPVISIHNTTNKIKNNFFPDYCWKRCS